MTAPLRAALERLEAEAERLRVDVTRPPYYANGIEYAVLTIRAALAEQDPIGGEPERYAAMVAEMEAADRAAVPEGAVDLDAALDVERLREAIHAERESFFGYEAPCEDNTCGCRLTAPQIAAEYAARLQAPPEPGALVNLHDAVLEWA